MRHFLQLSLESMESYVTLFGMNDRNMSALEQEMNDRLAREKAAAEAALEEKYESWGALSEEMGQ